jgi:hypothetical protein
MSKKATSPLSTAHVAARYTFPDLAHADALVAEHARLMPSQYATPAVWQTWVTRRDILIADLRDEETKVRHILCQKCRGTGMTGWVHRHGGVCYQCGGYGCKKAYRPVSA